MDRYDKWCDQCKARPCKYLTSKRIGIRQRSKESLSDRGVQTKITSNSRDKAPQNFQSKEDVIFARRNNKKPFEENKPPKKQTYSAKFGDIGTGTTKGREKTETPSKTMPLNSRDKAPQNLQSKEDVFDQRKNEKPLEENTLPEKQKDNAKSGDTGTGTTEGREKKETHSKTMPPSTPEEDKSETEMTTETCERTLDIISEGEKELKKKLCEGQPNQSQSSPEKILTDEQIETVLKVLSAAEECVKSFQNKQQPSSFAKAILPDDISECIIKTIPIVKLILAFIPHNRLVDLGFEAVQIMFTKEPKEWIVSGAIAVENFLMGTSSKYAKGAGVIVGLTLAMTTTAPGKEWLAAGACAASAAEYLENFLPQKMKLITKFISFSHKVQKSVDGKGGLNWVLSLASTVLGVIPQTKPLGAAVEFVRTIMYDLKGKGFAEGALCVAKTVVTNINMVPSIVRGIKKVASPIVNKIKKVASPIVDKIKKVASPIVDKIKKVASPIVDKIKKVASPIVDKIKKVASPIVDKIKKVASPIVNKIKDVASPIVDKIKDVASPIVDKIKDVASSARSWIDTAFRWAGFW